MKAVYRSISLSRDEVNYLVSTRFLPEVLFQYLQHNTCWNLDDIATLKLLPVMAEKFREVFTERLAKVGFNEAYGLTKEGELLEVLIDRFYCS